MKWTDIAFTPDEAEAAEAMAAWSWLVPAPRRILLSSMFGDLFLETADGDVVWLECGTGSVKSVAGSAEAFDAFLSGPRDAAWEERIDEWFLPGFVEKLHAAGKRPGPGQCYGMTILPVFKEGLYTVDNAYVLPAMEWFGATASIHLRIRDLPDGARVELKVVD